MTFNAWTHVVGQYDGSKLSLYLNGTLQEEKTTTYDNQTATTKPLQIGSGDRSVANFSGKLYDFRYFNRGLSLTELSKIYSNRTVLGDEGLIMLTTQYTTRNHGSVSITTPTTTGTIRLSTDEIPLTMSNTELTITERAGNPIKPTVVAMPLELVPSDVHQSISRNLVVGDLINHTYEGHNPHFVQRNNRYNDLGVIYTFSDPSSVLIETITQGVGGSNTYIDVTNPILTSSDTYLHRHQYIWSNNQSTLDISAAVPVFDGTNYLTIPYTPKLNTAQFAVAVWVNTHQLVSIQRIFDSFFYGGPPSTLRHGFHVLNYDSRWTFRIENAI